MLQKNPWMKVVVDTDPVLTPPSAPIEPVERFKGVDHRKTEYTCALCRETVVGSSEFVGHCRKLHSGNRFRCDACDYVTKHKRVIYDHRLKRHNLVWSTDGRRAVVYRCTVRL